MGSGPPCACSHVQASGDLLCWAACHPLWKLCSLIGVTTTPLARVLGPSLGSLHSLLALRSMRHTLPCPPDLPYSPPHPSSAMPAADQPLAAGPEWRTLMASSIPLAIHRHTAWSCRTLHGAEQQRHGTNQCSYPAALHLLSSALVSVLPYHWAGVADAPAKAARPPECQLLGKPLRARRRSPSAALIQGCSQICLRQECNSSRVLARRAEARRGRLCFGEACGSHTPMSVKTEGARKRMSTRVRKVQRLAQPGKSLMRRFSQP
jgi:hypothetical protein